jgi:hypothetical protein
MHLPWFLNDGSQKRFLHPYVFAFIPEAATQIGGIRQAPIDCQRLTRIVIGQFESNLMHASELVATIDPPMLPVDGLVHDRFVFDDLTLADFENQIAVILESVPLGPIKAEFNLVGSAPGASTKSYSNSRGFP